MLNNHDLKVFITKLNKILPFLIIIHLWPRVGYDIFTTKEIVLTNQCNLSSSLSTNHREIQEERQLEKESVEVYCLKRVQ